MLHRKMTQCKKEVFEMILIPIVFLVGTLGLTLMLTFDRNAR